MWSTCSGTEIPVTFEKGNSTEERSDYFTILFEEAVRKATEGNERKEIEESEDVPFDLPPFLTPPIMPSQPNVFADLTLKLGMVSDSNPPPQAHDFEEEMRLEAILANKTLTERDLETISGDNKDEAEKQQPPTEKTEEPENVRSDMEGLIQGAEDGKPISPTVRTEDSEFQTMEGLIKGAEDGNPMSPTVRTEESEFKTPTAAESQTEMETPSIFLNTPSAVYSQPENAPTSMNIDEEEDPDNVQVPKLVKRKKNVPLKLLSPFLTQYSHLLVGEEQLNQKEKDMRCVLDYAFGKGSPTQVLYTDDWNIVTREEFQTLAPNVWVMNNVIDTFARILNDDPDQSVKSNLKFYFSTIPFNMLCQNEPYGGSQDSQATEGKRLENFILSVRHEYVTAGVKSLKGFHLLFFPVWSGDHFYLIVINQKAKKVEIIDNLSLPEGITYDDKYKTFAERTFEAWTIFCEQEGHPLRKAQISAYEIVLLEMPWKNRTNKTDCGVYAMRHMETYKGNQTWNCGFKNTDEDKDFICKLRMRYGTEILLSVLNKRHELTYLALKRANQVE
ncbi:uncharacterized protein [Spinacia oleracea]|uniref:Ubiquitin-like protease family profile domain-containing protein n=1 Tax=Spinacia oleracea TaxID=3562 RepID=A0ABM3RQY8_SPIOL|nr:uncharacterized protein LOC110790057 [Spinacia oleracea]